MPTCCELTARPHELLRNKLSRVLWLDQIITFADTKPRSSNILYNKIYAPLLFALTLYPLKTCKIYIKSSSLSDTFLLYFENSLVIEIISSQYTQTLTSYSSYIFLIKFYFQDSFNSLLGLPPMIHQMVLSGWRSRS